MRIYIIRHAESQANQDETILRRIKDSDINITDVGRVQALKVGEWLAAELKHVCPVASKTKLWYSPYKRTIETMNPIVKKLGIKTEGGLLDDIVANPLLREQNLGDFAGYSHTLEERAALFPEAHAYFQKEWEAGRSYWAPRPNGESREDVAKRMDAFIPSLHEDLANGVTDCVIVGHGIAHRLLVKQLTGKSVEEFDKEPNPGNCHVRMLEMDANQKVVDHGYVYTGERLEQRATHICWNR